jgi:hypothetical protein
LNIHNISDVRQIEILTAEPLVPGPSHFEVEIAIAYLNKYRSPCNDQIPAELIQVGGETLMSAIHKCINSICNKEELPDPWKESIIVPIHKKGDKNGCNNYHGISFHIIQHFIEHPSLKIKSIHTRNYCESSV